MNGPRGFSRFRPLMTEMRPDQVLCLITLGLINIMILIRLGVVIISDH